jgi:hypothetical protein
MANRKTLRNDTVDLSVCVGNKLITHNSYSPDGLFSLPPTLGLLTFNV